MNKKDEHVMEEVFKNPVAISDSMRMVVEAVPSALIMVNQEGCITLANAQAENVFGYLRSELIGKQVEMLIPELYQVIHPRHRGEFFANPCVQPMGKGRDLYGMHMDGHEVPVEIALNPVITSEGTFVLASIIDITQRKEAEAGLCRARDELERRVAERTMELAATNESLLNEIDQRKAADAALRESDLRVRLATETSEVGIWEWNVRSNKIRWDSQMFRIYGIEPSQDGLVEYGDWSQAVLPEDLSSQEEILRDTVRKAGRSTREFRIRRRDNGECRFIQAVETVRTDSSGQSEWVVGTNLDITERRLAEKELQIINRIILTCATTLNVEELLNKVMDEALAISGLEGGTICFVTQDETLQIAAYRETSEATLEDLSTHTVKVGDCLCGQCARDHKPLVLPDRKSVLEYSTREATRGEIILFHAAFPLISGERCVGVLCVFTRTGKKPDERSLKLLETVSSQIGMAIDNARLYLESVQQAFTLEKKVEKRTAELAAANERLKEIDRLKSLFIASMSHELRTPLNSVIGFSSILLNGWIGTLNDEQKKSLSSILRSGKHLLSLINDVIDVSKVEAGIIDIEYDEFDLGDLLVEVEQNFVKEALDRKLALSVEKCSVTMRTDRRRLHQCCLNLIGNAIKYTEQGAITVAVTHHKEGGNVTISVTDTGIGFTVADQENLFQPFSRIRSHLSAKVLGTGLGLYLTRKICVEILQGSIYATSEPGSGSTFVMTIPAAIDNNHAIQPVTNEAEVK